MGLCILNKNPPRFIREIHDRDWSLGRPEDLCHQKLGSKNMSCGVQHLKPGKLPGEKSGFFCSILIHGIHGRLAYMKTIKHPPSM